MINKPPPFKGLNIRIPITIPIKGRGLINQGSGLLCTRAAQHRDHRKAVWHSGMENIWRICQSVEDKNLSVVSSVQAAAVTAKPGL